MFIMMLAATMFASAPQPKKGAPLCSSAIILVSKSLEPDIVPQIKPHLRREQPDPKGPAVLMPACKLEERKKNDFPLA